MKNLLCSRLEVTVPTVASFITKHTRSGVFCRRMFLAWVSWVLEGRHDGFELLIVAIQVKYAVRWMTLGEANHGVPLVGLGDPAVLANVRTFYRIGAAECGSVHTHASFNGIWETAGWNAVVHDLGTRKWQQSYCELWSEGATKGILEREFERLILVLLPTGCIQGARSSNGGGDFGTRRSWSGWCRRCGRGWSCCGRRGR